MIVYNGTFNHIENNSFTNYYIVCKTTGSNLQWSIDSGVALIAYSSSDPITERHAQTLSGFRYVSFLLVKEGSGLSTTFVSMLILTVDSTVTSDTFSILCTNNNDPAVTVQTVSASLQGVNGNVTLGTPNIDGTMQFLFMTNVSGMESYFILCGTNNMNLEWRVAVPSILAPVIRSSDTLGMRFVSSDSMEFAYLIGTQQFSTVSLLVTSRSPPADITCVSDNFRAVVCIDCIRNPIPTPTPTPTPVMATTPTTAGKYVWCISTYHHLGPLLCTQCYEFTNCRKLKHVGITVINSFKIHANNEYSTLYLANI